MKIIDEKEIRKSTTVSTVSGLLTVGSTDVGIRDAGHGVVGLNSNLFVGFLYSVFRSSLSPFSFLDIVFLIIQ